MQTDGGDGGCCTYIMTIENAARLLSSAAVWNVDFFPEVEDPEDTGGSIFDSVESAVQKLCRIITYACQQFISSNSAASCITSACIIPMPYTSYSIPESDVYLGIFNTNVPGKRLTNRGRQDAASVTIPWQAADWRRNGPYHEVMLYIPYIGNISIPTSSIIDDSTISVDVSIDSSTGDAIFVVAVGSISAGSVTKVIGQYASNLSANFPIGASNVSAGQVATTIAGAAAGVAATLAAPGVGGVAAAGVATIYGELNNATPLPSTIGSAGGGAILALFGYNIRCMSIYHDTNVSPDSVSDQIGTPTMAVKSLSTLSGFVQCSNAHVQLAAHLDEMNEVDNFLNTGIYLE